MVLLKDKNPFYLSYAISKLDASASLPSVRVSVPPDRVRYIHSFPEASNETPLPESPETVLNV